MPDSNRDLRKVVIGAGLALLRAEVAAARIEALTRAEPAVGQLWRTEAAFAEAVRSVALKDLRHAWKFERIVGGGEDAELQGDQGDDLGWDHLRKAATRGETGPPRRST